MWPEYFPIISVDDIIPPPPQEYEDDDGRKSAIGWLKHILLYDNSDSNYFWISKETRENYKKAIDILRQECKIGRGETLEDWEDRASRREQAAAVNAVRKKLGYTQEIYVEY